MERFMCVCVCLCYLGCLKSYFDAVKVGLLLVTTPTTTQHNLNTDVGLDTKMTMQTTPPPTPPQKLNISLQEPQINIY